MGKKSQNRVTPVLKKTARFFSLISDPLTRCGFVLDIKETADNLTSKYFLFKSADKSNRQSFLGDALKKEKHLCNVILKSKFSL